MDNKLSKPVAWRYRYTKPGITDSNGEAWVGDWKFVTDEVNCNPAPNYQKCALYSQEYVSALLAELEAKDKRIAELEAIRAAAEKLVRCKGRYHSEQNYRALAALFGVTTPDLPPVDGDDV